MKTLNSPEREKILKKIRRASKRRYVTEWDDTGRIAVQKKKSNVKRGKKSKAKGGLFELRVRRDLEEKGWIVDKWSNNVDLDEGKIIPAKKKFNPFSKVMAIGTGFPDFIALQPMGKGKHRLIGVEVKINGKLSREEKKKFLWYGEHEVFSEMLVAKKVKEKGRVRVEYVEVNEILKKMRK